MNFKVLVEVYVPELDIKYNLFIPSSKKIGNVILNLVKAISELTQGAYPREYNHALMNSDTCQIYDKFKFKRCWYLKWNKVNSYLIIKLLRIIKIFLTVLF